MAKANTVLNAALTGAIRSAATSIRNDWSDRISMSSSRNDILFDKYSIERIKLRDRVDQLIESYPSEYTRLITNLLTRNWIIGLYKHIRLATEDTDSISIAEKIKLIQFTGERLYEIGFLLAAGATKEVTKFTTDLVWWDPDHAKTFRRDITWPLENAYTEGSGSTWVRCQLNAMSIKRHI